MTARRTMLKVEELAQRILPSMSPVIPGILGPAANPGGTPSLLASGNPGSNTATAPGLLANVNPGGPVSRSLPVLAQTQIDLLRPGPLLGGVSQPVQKLAIHNAQQLLTATGLNTAQLAADLNVPSIDWHTQMIVLVSEGLSSYGAWSPKVDITALNVAHGDLTVQWHLVRPNPQGPMPMFMRLGDPAQVVLTTAFSGPVAFHQNPTVTLPAHDALAGHGSGSYAVSSLLAAVDPPVASGGHSTSLNVIVGDVGERYDFNGVADLAQLGKVTVSGSAYGLGNIATGNAVGVLTFSNAEGSVTISLKGPSQPGFSPLPSQFQYTVVSGSGSFQNVQDQGTLSLVLHPGTGLTAGTFTLAIP